MLVISRCQICDGSPEAKDTNPLGDPVWQVRCLAPTCLRHKWVSVSEWEARKQNFRIGFDVHGVLDDARVGPFFAFLTRQLVRHGHEVHLITGSEASEGLFDLLRNLGVSWTHFFSITDHHKAQGTEIVRDSLGRPWFDSKLWNPTKAAYCAEHKIDIHFDDSAIYQRYFGSPYCQVTYEDTHDENPNLHARHGLAPPGSRDYLDRESAESTAGK